MVIWMNNKSKMILLFLIMICLAISVVYVIKREDDKMSKIEDKVSKIEVGETYKATFFENVYDAEENFQEKGESYEYIKILDNKRFYLYQIMLIYQIDTIKQMEIVKSLQLKWELIK